MMFADEDMNKDSNKTAIKQMRYFTLLQVRRKNLAFALISCVIAYFRVQ
jgi:hypothetical protein